MNEHRIALGLFGGVLALWLVAMGIALTGAALPDGEGDGLVLAVFPPGTPDTEMFAALARAGGEPVRATWVGFAWVTRGDGEGFVGRIRREGAWAAFGDIPVAGPALGGCMAVSVDRTRAAEYRVRP